MLFIPLGLLRSLFDLAKTVAVSLLLLWVANCLLLPLLTNYQFTEFAQTYYSTWTLLSFVSCSIWMVLGVRFLWAVSQSQAVTRLATALLIFIAVAVQSFPMLAKYIGSSDRPVYSVSAVDMTARDYGMYFKLGEQGFGFNPGLDAFMRGLMLALQEDAVREPFIKGYLNNVLSQYVRAVVGDVLMGEGLSKDQLVRLAPVTETFQAKIWTLHHLVNTQQSSIDHEQLANLVVEGEQQLEADIPQDAARQFLFLAGDAYLETLNRRDKAVISYQRAREYDVDRETCEHLVARHLSALLPQVGCGN